MPDFEGRPFDGIYRPIVDVHLMLPNGRALFQPAIVDSGADDTTVPAKVLAAFGIGWKRLKLAPIPRSKGVGGEVDQRVCPVTVRWDNKVFTTRVHVIRELDVMVLGRGEFFKKFSVTFERWDEDPPVFSIEHRK